MVRQMAKTRRAALLASMLLSFDLLAQSDTRAEEFFGQIHTVDERDFHAKLEELARECQDIHADSCPQGGEVLSQLFGETYRQELPDFIVLLEKDASGRWRASRPTLMWDGKNTPYLFGARYLYALVFAPERLSLEAGITTEYQRPRNPLTPVLTVLGASDAAAAEEPDPESSSVAIEWLPLSGSTDNTRLWYGSARLPIGLDSTNRITISFRQPVQTLTVSEVRPPPAGSNTTSASATTTTLKEEIIGPAPLARTMPSSEVIGITGHFSNTSNSRTAFSLGLGLTFDAADTKLMEDQAINGYALAKIYARKPRLNARGETSSLYRPSWAIVFGTNIADDAFDEAVLGISWGHVLGNAGFFFAGNLVREAETENGTDRKWKFLLGLEYSF